MWQLHSASPLRSATYISKHVGANQTEHACYSTVVGQRAAAASQSAGCYRLTACCHTNRPEVTAAKVWAYLHAFWKNVIIFITTTPIDIKPSTCPANGRYADTCTNGKFHHRTAWRLGGDRKQTK